jgi:LPXTG-motif cell wall-anchored protein
MFAAAALVWTVSVAFAQAPMDNRTFFTFSGPVAIPGVTLPAGKYLFRLADTSSRNVLQVVSADGKTPYAVFFFHRIDRAEISKNSEIRFMETAAGMPQAVRAWWYAGDRSGYEFVYPKEQARLLAKGTGTPVLTMAVPAAAPAAVTPPLATVSPAGKEAPVAAATPAPAPPPGPSLVGEAAPSSIPVAEPTLQARAALPRTGTGTPLVGLIGLVLLLGAVLARKWRLTLG